MKILVAGASGFIGSAVCRALLEAGHAVVGLSRSRGSMPEAAQHVPLDAGAAPIDPAPFEGIEAIVNLVGIAVERGENTFEAAHVRTVEHLLTLARTLEVDRFVHVSVVRPEGSEGGYHRSKREGEARVRHSEARWTILRPGLVYGPGDAMLSNLVRFVTLAPVFAAPGGHGGPLQTVDVRDVAAAVVETLADEGTIGLTADVVGSERYTLPQLVEAVADALSLPTLVLRLPQPLMRAAAGVMVRVLPSPPITPTQLGMLIDGLYGDVSQTRALGIEPRALSAETIREVARRVEAPSLRLLPSAQARADATRWEVPLWFVPLAVVALLLGPWLVTDVWLRMLGLEAALVAVLIGLGAPLRTWLAPRHVGLGLGLAAVMIAGALGVTAGLRVLTPGLMDRAANVYAWADAWPLGFLAVLLPLIAAGEDLVWRFGITVGLVGRLGPAGAVAVGALAFALAHASTGPPVLALAALLAGLLWSALAVRTRSLLPVLLCHVLFDVSVVALAP